MTATTDIVRDLRLHWTDGRPVERLAYVVGAVLLLSGLAHLGVQAVLGGPWDGPVSWRKPTTFGLSFGLTVLSVTWVASFLRMRERLRAVLLGGFLLASVPEVALIDLQAWRRVPSHFNFETSFDTRVTMVLAAGGGVLFLVLGALFAQSLRPQPGLDPPLRLGIRLGFGALLAGLVVGAVMIGIGTALVRAGDPQAAYHGAGVLKLAHAVGLHGIAVLPGLAWLSGYAGWPAGARRSVLRTGTVGYLGVLAGALWVGARGELSSITVFGIALAGSVLVSAVFRVLLALRAGKRVVSESVVR
ncbi:MAG TPA: hypothetical protein VH141_07095 [Pseudonocardia sp.]|jgi:hypothetical protein|nr:hypothetical protein [Pseudonocardia sp.]